MSVDAASLKTVAVQLRALAADRDNQPIIARDEGCMSALASFVQSEDVSVCSVAVQALLHLSSHGDNKEIVRNDFGVWENLTALVEKQGVDINLRREAVKVMKNVVNDDEEEELEDIKDLERRAGLRLESTKVVNEASYDLLKDPATVRVHVHGLSDADFLDDFEHRVIRTRGVLSVSYEMGAEVVIIFCRISRDDVQKVLSQIAGKEVEVLEDQQEEEEEENKDDENLKKEDENGYIDQDRLRFKKNAEKLKRTSVAQTGYTSLAQRLEKERQQAEREKARSERMLGRIGRGFTSGWGFW
eukprot:Plantae.Rhodophyta-Purpureofilum_apyrenoidigerum.ctg1764.p1 GENE.Plantae.Rhodophyta-Purpureofilum_apyrenoidigerum.ctg1764~~Plantae.Rhodophyta-Purpureofilum_apyrenoidigerum.ctg1764.p1  ORF type:complete len:321 (-),score=88.69 Plantae.Rhodophyta-Purpureofilum_apyrenoidigerum.ctg1764:1832-2734(-)